MVKKVVPYSRPVIDKPSNLHPFVFTKDVLTYVKTLIVKGEKQLSWDPESFLLLPVINVLLLVKDLILLYKYWDLL